MKKFLLRLVVVLSPLAVLSLPADLLLSSALSRLPLFAGEYEVWNDLYSGRSASEVLIYGSSRAWVHVDPAVLTDTLGVTVYNYGMDGQNFMMQYLRHSEHVKYNRWPRIIVVSLDVFTLGYKAGLYNQEQFLPYMLWNSDIKRYAGHYQAFNVADYYAPLVRYVGRPKVVYETLAAMVGIGDSRPPRRLRGYAAQDKSWNMDLEQAMRRGQHKVALDSTQINLFRRFLRECQQQKVEIVMVYTPEYIVGQHYTVNRQDVLALYQSISHEYGVPFLDYSDDAMCLNRDYYYNASHLNKKGAEKFSRMLASELKAAFPCGLGGAPSR